MDIVSSSRARQSHCCCCCADGISSVHFQPDLGFNLQFVFTSADDFTYSFLFLFPALAVVIVEVVAVPVQTFHSRAVGFQANN